MCVTASLGLTDTKYTINAKRIPGETVKMPKYPAYTLMNNIMLGEVRVYTTVAQMRLSQNADTMTSLQKH